MAASKPLPASKLAYELAHQLARLNTPESKRAPVVIMDPDCNILGTIGETGYSHATNTVVLYTTKYDDTVTQLYQWHTSGSDQTDAMIMHEPCGYTIWGEDTTDLQKIMDAVHAHRCER